MRGIYLGGERLVSLEPPIEGLLWDVVEAYLTRWQTPPKCLVVSPHYLARCLRVMKKAGGKGLKLDQEGHLTFHEIPLASRYHLPSTTLLGVPIEMDRLRAQWEVQRGRPFEVVIHARRHTIWRGVGEEEPLPTAGTATYERFIIP